MSDVPTGLLLFILLLQVDPSSAQESYQRGKNAFDRGEFSRAAEILQPLLYPEPKLPTWQKTVEARRLLGTSYLFQKREDEAREEFRKLLQVQPDYKLDPRLDPPEVVDFFNSVRKEHEEELKSLEAKRESAERRAKEDCSRVRLEPVIIEKRLGRNSFLVNLVPFGAGQFQNGHTTKGWILFSAEATLAAASMGSLLAKLWLYGLRPERRCRFDLATECPPEFIDHTDENRARWLTRFQLGSGILFFAAAGYGIADALYYYQPETLLAFSPKPSPKTLTGKILPVPVGDTMGPGLFFRF
jgi:tetratricopeptide (TPR) repeat protein